MVSNMLFGSAPESLTLTDLGHEITVLFQQTSNLGDRDDTNAEDWPSAALSFEADRFHLWAVNLGLFVSGHGSLDYRLREARILEQAIRTFLRCLAGSLRELIQLGNGEDPGLDGRNTETEDSASDSDVSDYEDTDQPGTEILLDAIRDILNRLYKVSTKIRNTSSRSGLSRATRYQQIDPESGVDLLQAIAPFDYDYVRSLFLEYQKLRVSQETKEAPPLEGSNENNDDAVCVDAVWEPIRTVLALDQASVPSFLVHRISRSNTSRRQQFAYWKKHREKLEIHTRASISTHVSLLPTQDTALGFQMDNTPSNNLATPLQDTHGNFAPTVTTATVLNTTRLEVVSSKSVVSVSEYEPSLWLPARDSVDFPPPPKARPSANSFECPYCFVICSNATLADKAWKAHLIHDLRPYICTYEDCRTPDQLYETRRDWNHHENTCHRPLWRCLEHVDLAFTQLEAYQTHLRAEHGAYTDDISMSRIIHASESVTTVTDRLCPICSVVLDNLRDSQNHIALHLERFALFSLPRSTGLDSDDVSNSNSDMAQGTIAGSRDDAFDSDLDINSWSHWSDADHGTNRSTEVQPSTEEERVIEDTGDASSVVPDIKAESPAEDITEPVTDNMKTWRIDGTTTQVIDHDHEGPVHTLVFSPDGKLLASASNELVRISDLETQKSLPAPEAEDWGVAMSLAWSHDSKRLAAGSMGKTIKIWNVSTGTCLHTLVGHNGPVRALAFSKDDKFLVSGSHDKTCKVWDLESGTEHLSLAPIIREVTAVGISPDNRFLVSGSNDGCARIYDLETGGLLHFIVKERHSRPISAIAFHSPTSHPPMLATASGDGKIKLWDLASGQIIRTLAGHKEDLTLLAFSPDQSYMVSGSMDDIVRVWGTGAWETIGTLPEQSKGIYAVTFSQDGSRLAFPSGGRIAIRELTRLARQASDDVKV